jgi:hypothetical protein
METQNSETKPIQETTQTEKQGGESQEDEAASLPIAEPTHGETKAQEAEERRDETDREKDKAFNKLADAEEQQTKWEKMQGEWTRNGAAMTALLSLLTLFVLFHQACTLSKQLESMQSSSKDTQEMIRAMQKQAEASHDIAAATSKQADASITQAKASETIAGQNKELVGHAGEQAKAMQTQALASMAQAEAAKQSIGVAQITAKAAERSADMAAKSLRGERPVIFFKTVGIKTLAPNQPAHIDVRLRNSGKTTARHIALETDFILMVIPFSNALKYHGNSANDAFDITLPAGDEMTLNVWTQFSIEEIQFNAIKSGIIKFFFYGRGQYTDDFGGNFTFTFCHVYDPETSTLIHCPANIKAQ